MFVCFFPFSFFVTCFVQNVPRWNDSSLQAPRVSFICNWVSRKIARCLRSFFGVVNGQRRTNKLGRHKRRTLEPLPPNSSWGSSFQKQIFLQSLHASVKDEETVMLNLYREVSNSAFESFIITAAVQIPDIFCTETNWLLQWEGNLNSEQTLHNIMVVMELNSVSSTKYEYWVLRKLSLQYWVGAKLQQ